jgi:hypothetical protein
LVVKARDKTEEAVARAGDRGGAGDVRAVFLRPLFMKFATMVSLFSASCVHGVFLLRFSLWAGSIVLYQLCIRGHEFCSRPCYSVRWRSQQYLQDNVAKRQKVRPPL